MGNASALTCWQVLANSERALAIELLAAAQGVEFLAPLEPGTGTKAAHHAIRALSPALVEDRPLGEDIERVAEAVRSGGLVAAAEAEVGALA
jgi:histidine ammonia-lyase